FVFHCAPHFYKMIPTNTSITIPLPVLSANSGGPMNPAIAPALESLKPALTRVFELATKKIVDLDRTWESAGPNKGTPVFTINGKYTSRGWTEWTQGFQ